MKINQNTDGKRLTLAIEGRLDTTTAPELEKIIDNIDEAEELVLDCKELEYISSAGLRVILKGQKLMKSKGKMIICNVNETVMEVFEITGFSEILTIK